MYLVNNADSNRFEIELFECNYCSCVCVRACVCALVFSKICSYTSDKTIAFMETVDSVK